MTIHLTRSEDNLRRAVLSCDAPGCQNQLEPPPAERWRSDADARSIARDHATGWAYDGAAGTDYCPRHIELEAAHAAGSARLPNQD